MCYYYGSQLGYPNPIGVPELNLPGEPAIYGLIRYGRACGREGTVFHPLVQNGALRRHLSQGVFAAVESKCLAWPNQPSVDQVHQRHLGPPALQG